MSKSIKRPVICGLAKVPVVMQLENTECGAACLCMILAYYDKWIPLEKVREDCGVSRDGSKARNMARAARRYGLKVRGFRWRSETLKKNGAFPCIVHWNFNHFVVLNGFRGNRAYLNDPADGSYHLSIEEFDRCFTGICMFFEPGEDFEPTGKKKSILSFAFKRLRGTAFAVAFTVLFGVITSLFDLIAPAFTRLFLDYLLPGDNRNMVMPFLIAMTVFTVLEFIMNAYESVYNYRISGKLAAVGNASFFWKVLKMPMKFHSQRMAGDIQVRQTSNASIADTLVNIFAPLALNIIMMLFYLVVMLRYNWILTLVGIVSLSINAIVSMLISAKRINISRVMLRDNAQLASTTVTGISMIETIKSSGAENGYFARWSGFQANANYQQVKALKLNQYLGMIPLFVSKIADYTILLLGVWLAMRGELTVGMIMAFQSFLTSFMKPALDTISNGQQLQEMRSDMERVDDVLEYPDEDIFALDCGSGGITKLKGEIELKNVTFGYSALEKPLIRDFSLAVVPGESVAIVGATGCGKSTLSKLISGLYKPWGGEILFDGVPMNRIAKDVFRSSLSVVDQDIVLFEDTIADNIRMWDDSIKDFEVVIAARDAYIHDEIMQRPNGYQYKLLENGKDLSGGQRQRIEIARVLATDPSIIIMDEATSALDSDTEYNIMKAMSARGITSLIIAHRLSAIRSCDRIIVMDNGAIIDCGTHAELFERCEKYHDLINAE